MHTLDAIARTRACSIAAAGLFCPTERARMTAATQAAAAMQEAEAAGEEEEEEEGMEMGGGGR